MTTEQKLFFETNGYLVIENALTPDELERVRASADRAEAIWRADKTRKGRRGPNLEQIQAIIEYDDIFLDLMEHPKVFPLIREILGADISMVDNDYFITPPRQTTHAHWHRDEALPGAHHPGSTLMVKAFWLLSDVPPRGGGTAILPGSHRTPNDFPLAKVADPADLPGAVRMEHAAGTAYFFHGHIYHAALHNESDQPRRVLIFNYGHFWMKPWQGYEPSDTLKAKATTPIRKQLLHIGDAYGQYLK